MARKKKPTKHTSNYGLGRVYPRESGIWWIEVPDGNGGRIRKSSESKDRNEAEEKLIALRKQLHGGEVYAIDTPMAGAWTVARALDEYMERRGPQLGEGTRETYRGQVPPLKHTLGFLLLAKLTTDDLTNYREARAKDPIGKHAGEGYCHSKGTPKLVSQSTINRELALLRAAMKDLAKRRPKLLPTLPYFPMESEKNNIRKGHITEEEFTQKLYPQLPRHLKAFAACAFGVGGRKSEWLRLKWEDVNFAMQEILFRKTKNHDQRVVPIVPGIMETALREQWEIHRAAWPNVEDVFVYDGKPMVTIGKAFHKACVRAGFPNLLIHDARRSANRLMRDKGISQPVRMAIMGHRTASQDIRYGVVDRDDITGAREKLATEKTPKPKRELKRIG